MHTRTQHRGRSQAGFQKQMGLYIILLLKEVQHRMALQLPHPVVWTTNPITPTPVQISEK